jgi:hypothetical protein
VLSSCLASAVKRSSGSVCQSLSISAGVRQDESLLCALMVVHCKPKGVICMLFGCCFSQMDQFFSGQ